MARGNQWIGARCAAGKNLSTEIQKWAAPIYDEIKFIDLGKTSSGVSGDGSSWDLACKDFNDACDKLENTDSGKTRAFFVRGRVTSGNMMGADQEIDVRHVDVIGAGMPYGGGTQNSTVTLYHTPTQTAGGTPYSPTYSLVGLLADERDINLHGLHFYNPDASDNQFEFAWGSDDGQMSAITDCIFEGQSDGDTTDATCGIYATGTIMNVIMRNRFNYCEIGFAGRGGSSRYFHNATIADNIFSCNATSIHLLAAASANVVKDNLIMQKGYLGYTLVAGIDCDASANNNVFLNNVCFDGTEATAYLDGGTTNYWIGNLYGDASAGAGTAYNAT